MTDAINQTKDVLGIEDSDDKKLEKIEQKKEEDQLTHREELEKQEIKNKQVEEERIAREDGEAGQG